jgi:hypothetical protein
LIFKKYLVEPQGNVWVATSDEGLGKSLLQERVAQVDHWFFDLDDTHTDSPAAEMARKAVRTSRLSPYWLGWVARTGPQLLTKGKGAHSESWKAYVDTFLKDPETGRFRDPKTEGELYEMFRDPESRLYKGVVDFSKELGLLREEGKKGPTAAYVTRNLAVVARQFAKHLGIDSVHAEVGDKYDKIFARRSEIEKRNGDLNYGVIGDSREDEGVVRALSGAANVLSIQVMDRPGRRQLDGFDVAIGKDYRGLVDLMQ